MGELQKVREVSATSAGSSNYKRAKKEKRRQWSMQFVELLLHEFESEDNEEKEQQHAFILMLERSGIETASNIGKPPFPTRVSPLRYPGGKSKVIGQILAKCRTENMVNFAEAYAGGASVGLSLLLAGKVQELYLKEP